MHSPTHTHTHTAHHPHIIHTFALAASPLFPHAQTLFQWPVHAHTPPPVLTPLAALALPLPWDKRLQEERERWATDYGRRREKWGAILTHSSDRSSFHLHNETAADTLIRKHPELFLPRKALLTDCKKPGERVATDSEKQLFKCVFLREGEKGDVKTERGRV